MGKTRSSDDFWRLRHLAKRLIGVAAEWPIEKISEVRSSSPRYQELDRQFERIWERYGLKSEVSNNRRRATRKTSQRNQRIIFRAGKRADRRS